MEHLKIEERGYPVPFFSTALGGGKHDFRVIDGTKTEMVMKNHCCGVCGKKLHKDAAYFVTGIIGLNNRASQYALHRTCAEFSLECCPHIKYEKAERRDNNMENYNIASDALSLDKPTEWFLIKGKPNYKIERVGNQEIIRYKYISHERYVYVNGILQKADD
jgi:hypothetical protein